MYSGAGAAAEVPLAEYIMGQGIVYEAFSPLESEGKVHICFQKLYHSEFCYFWISWSFFQHKLYGYVPACWRKPVSEWHCDFSGQDLG